jgi:DUF1365 family protein
MGDGKNAPPHVKAAIGDGLRHLISLSKRISLIIHWENMNKNCLYVGKVYHARHRPFTHAFTYRVFTLFIDLDDLAAADKVITLFGYNKWNVLSFHDRDHGPRDGTALRPWIEAAAREKGIDLAGGRIMFLGFPRLWGFVFNPLSIFYCYDRNGCLAAVLYQVKNTFGDQHGYLIPVTERTGDKISQECQKIFHVSPFIQMDCIYKFRLREPDARLDVAIHQFQPDGKILTATWDGEKRPFSSMGILLCVLTHPLMTIKVVAAIHWEALWLWVKGTKYIPRPLPPQKDVT